MYNSILQFMGSGIEEIEKLIKEFVRDSEMSVGDLVMGLNKPLQELLCSIISETLEQLDMQYRESESRKNQYVIERSNVENSFLSTCGQITYKRTYFKDKKTQDYKYLVDEAGGITKNMRKSDDVVIESLKHAVDSSYRISGEHATQTDDIISKQAVMKDIHELEIPNYIPQVKEKKKVKVLYINADEDHVSLQFHKIKGDLKKNSNGRKSNTMESRLVYVFEGICAEYPGSKRKKLVNSHYFTGTDKEKNNIFEEVLDYIDAVYDEQYLEKIYLMGDGAAWIKSGLDILGAKSVFVLDKFHLNQSIMRAVNHLGDSIQDAKDAIYDAIKMEELDEVKDLLNTASELAETQSKKEQIRRTKAYITNHWESIIISNNDHNAKMGCSAEGHVSHLLSSRLSSRPLGWSVTGAAKVAKLRIYVANGGNIIDIVKYKKTVIKQKIRQEIIDNFDRQIRANRKTYTDAWACRSVPSSIGKVDGMYCAFKSFRGICG